MEDLNLFLQVFIIIIQVPIFFIPLFGTKVLFDMRYKGFKRATKRGWLLLCLIALGMTCSIFQSILSRRINDLKEIESKKEIALILSNNDAPVLYICDMTVERADTAKLKIAFSICSTDATTKNPTMSIDVIAVNPTSQKYIYLSKNLNVFYPNAVIPTGEGYTTGYELNHPDTTNKIYYFRFYGKYEKRDKSLINVDLLYFCDTRKEKAFGIPSPFSEEQLRNIIKINNP
jgi:hypothetical protein